MAIQFNDEEMVLSALKVGASLPPGDDNAQHMG
jgi:hypothetical protein